MLFFILSSPQSLLQNRYIFASGRKEWKNFIILFYFIKKKSHCIISASSADWHVYGVQSLFLERS